MEQRRKYKWMNLIAVAEIVIVSLYLMMPFVPGAVPFSDDFEWKFVNYAPIVTVGALVLIDDLVAGVGEELVQGSEAHDRPRLWWRSSTVATSGHLPHWRSGWPRPPTRSRPAQPP